MPKTPVIKITANFESNLEDIERFLIEAEVPKAYDDLLDELLETAISNLERFPEMGRSFLARQPRSVETTSASARLSKKLSALTPDKDALREYVLKDYLLLYTLVGGAVYLLAIRHQRQLSSDFSPRNPAFRAERKGADRAAVDAFRLKKWERRPESTVEFV